MYVEVVVSVVRWECGVVVCTDISSAMSEFRNYYGCMLLRAEVTSVSLVWIARTVACDFNSVAVGGGVVWPEVVGSEAWPSSDSVYFEVSDSAWWVCCSTVLPVSRVCEGWFRSMTK